MGVEPGERRLATCLQHQLEGEALPGLQPGENKWCGICNLQNFVEVFECRNPQCSTS